MWYIFVAPFHVLKQNNCLKSGSTYSSFMIHDVRYILLFVDWVHCGNFVFNFWLIFLSLKLTSPSTRTKYNTQMLTVKVNAISNVTEWYKHNEYTHLPNILVYTLFSTSFDAQSVNSQLSCQLYVIHLRVLFPCPEYRIHVVCYILLFVLWVHQRYFFKEIGWFFCHLSRLNRQPEQEIMHKF